MCVRRFLISGYHSYQPFQEFGIARTADDSNGETPYEFWGKRYSRMRCLFFIEYMVASCDFLMHRSYDCMHPTMNTYWDGKCRIFLLLSSGLARDCESCSQVADIGHCMLPLDQHKFWVTHLETEFFNQGDLERNEGLPISPLMDRTKPGPTNGSNQVVKVCDWFFYHLRLYGDGRPDNDKQSCLSIYWMSTAVLNAYELARGTCAWSWLLLVWFLDYRQDFLRWLWCQQSPCGRTFFLGVLISYMNKRCPILYFGEPVHIWNSRALPISGQTFACLWILLRQAAPPKCLPRDFVQVLHDLFVPGSTVYTLLCLSVTTVYFWHLSGMNSQFSCCSTRNICEYRNIMYCI